MTAEENKDSENSAMMSTGGTGVEQKSLSFQENQKLWIAQSEEHFDKKQFTGW